MELAKIGAIIAGIVALFGLAFGSDYFISAALHARIDAVVNGIFETVNKGDQALEDRIDRLEKRQKDEFDRVWSEMKGE